MRVRPFKQTQWWLALLLITLLAFGLRLYHLDDQSMWSDEGLSLYRARQSLTDIFTNRIVIDDWPSQDTNPPFYFLLLHLARAVLGESVFSLRYVGALAGTVSVLLICQLGRLLFDRASGLMVAFLLAISPFHIWQSQEMRNYPVLMLLNLLSVSALVRLIVYKQQQKRWWLLFVGASLLATYTHYFGFFIFAFGVLSLLLAHWRQVWRWVLLAGVLAMPLAWVAYGRFTSGLQFDFRPVLVTDLLNHAASIYSVGIIPGVLQPWWRVLPVILLLALGIAWGWRYRRTETILALGYLIIPLALLVLLSISNPLYNGPRHLLIGLPPFLLLVANGVRWPKVGWLLFIAVIASQVVSISSQNQLVKDDIQGVATYLSEVVRPGDGVVLHDTVIGFAFDYYYDGPVAWTAVPRFARMDQAAETAVLDSYSQNVKRLWFVTEPTPRTNFPISALTDWADEQYVRVFDRRYPSLWLGVNLDVYVPDPVVAELPGGASAVDLVWVNGLQLRGIEAETAVPSGHEWWPNLYWAGLVDGDYLVVWQFTDEKGELWAEVNHSLWPNWPSAPPPTDALLYLPSRVQLPTGLPPGQYQVWLRLLDEATRQVIPFQDGRLEALMMPNLVIETAVNNQAAQLPPHTPLAVDWGDILLAGYTLDEATYRPGHLLAVVAHWQVQGAISQDYEWVVQLLDPAGQLAAETITTPTRADYPPHQWQPGEWLNGQTTLIIPPLADEGDYTVQMGLRDPQNGRFLHSRWFGPTFVSLGHVTVQPWPLITTLPDIASPLSVTVGDPIFADLAGYDVNAATIASGDTLSLTLFWQAQRETEDNYAVFIHLINERGEIVAQRDSLPVQGVRLTVSWRTGEVLIDEHQLVIGDDVEPGEYQLWVGLYDPDNGERPLIRENGTTMPEGRILLGSITVQSWR